MVYNLLFVMGGDDCILGQPKLYFGLSPLPVTVTTRIITFLVVDPNLNLHLPHPGRGSSNPRDIPACYVSLPVVQPITFPVDPAATWQGPS